MSETTTHPFDAAAAGYDATFTRRRLGRWLREAVWEQLGATFLPGERVLELGCGTGEDAVWLARRGVAVTATDAAPGMLAVARSKAEAAGVADRVTFARLDLAEIGDGVIPNITGQSDHRHSTLSSAERVSKGAGGARPHPSIRPAGLLRMLCGTSLNSVLRCNTNLQSPISQYDGAFSNFGALNCLPDRRPLAQALASVVRPGGRVVLVVMGPLCPWELAWHLLHGQVGTALRRLRPGMQAHIGNGATVRVWYPSPRRLHLEFAPFFRHLETVGIGTLLPPPYLGHLAERWPRAFEALALVDRRFERMFPWTWLNDHYLAVFERS